MGCSGVHLPGQQGELTAVTRNFRLDPESYQREEYSPVSCRCGEQHHSFHMFAKATS